MNFRKPATILTHAFVLWALCGAAMGIGLAVTSEANALIIHAVAAPIIAAIVSLVYFQRYNYTTPLQTAVIFFVFAVLMDFFVVALLIVKSFAMFASPIGTWIPLSLVFLVTYLVGQYITKKQMAPTTAG
jgi:hypothetical protein